MLTGLPRPRPDNDTEPFWRGCAEERFLLQSCDDCGSFRWPPGPACPRCGAAGASWREASGAGTVYSWVTVAVPLHPALADQVPYVVGLVELAEGVRVVATIEGCAPAEIEAGMEVELRFDTDADGFRLPVFVPKQPKGGIS